MSMTLRQARVAIEAILESIPDSALPAFESVETTDGRTCVWYGGRGHYLGSAKRNGQRDPMIYRRSGAWDAIEGEMTYRADCRFLENGDSAEGLDLGKGKRAAR